MEKTGKTAIIILNYNNYEDTINCIESIENYNTADIKYVIVDNNSNRKGCKEELIHYLKKYGENACIIEDDNQQYAELPYITLMLSSKNDGYARGNNKGLKLVENDKEVTDILILNNDTLFIQDIIPHLLKYYYSLPDAGIISPLLYNKECEPDLRCGRKNTNIYKEIARKMFNYTLKLTHVDLSRKEYIISSIENIPELVEIELPSGSCMLINKSLFSKIGYFDPNTFLYVEENILYKKISSIKKKNYLCGNLKCIHLGGATTSTWETSKFLLECEKNSFVYYWKEYEKHSIILILLYKYAAYQHKILHMLINKYIKCSKK